jgi:hypothetical protein
MGDQWERDMRWKKERAVVIEPKPERRPRMMTPRTERRARELVTIAATHRRSRISINKVIYAMKREERRKARTAIGQHRSRHRDATKGKRTQAKRDQGKACPSQQGSLRWRSRRSRRRGAITSDKKGLEQGRDDQEKDKEEVEGEGEVRLECSKSSKSWDHQLRVGF